MAVRSSARSLLTANGLVAVTLIVGFASNIAIAALFGLTRRVDAFFAAVVLPNLFQALFVDYLGKNFLPTLARAKKESEGLASEVTSSVVTIVALMLLYPVTRYRDGRFLAWAAAWYALAKVFETFDTQVYRLLGGTTSGHTVKHLLAAAAVFAIVWQLRLRRPLQAASIARA